MLSGGDNPAERQGMTALAMGLLGGGSFNEALARGLGARQSAVDNYTKQQYMKTQLEGAQLDQQMKKLQMQRMGDAFKVLQQMQGGQSGAVPVGNVKPGQAGSGTMGMESVPNGISPSDMLTLQYRGGQGNPSSVMNQAPNAAAATASATPDQFRPTVKSDDWQWLRNATPDQLMALKLGGLDMTDLYKTAIEPKPTAAGSYVTMPGKGTVFLPNPEKGLTVKPDGSVGLMPNFLETTAAITGATKNAEMRATNQNTLAPIDRINPATNRPYDMTTDQLIQSMTGTLPTNADGSGLDFSRISPEMLKKMAIENPTALRNGIATFQSAQRPAPVASTTGFNGFRGPDDAARAAAEIEIGKNRTLKADDAYQGYKNELTKALGNDNQTITRNSFIEPLLGGFQTGKLGQGAALHVSNYIQNSSLDDGTKKRLISLVGSGDPTTGKFIENQLASAALTTMLQTLDGNGKPNQAIFKALTPAQESIESGNGTLKDVFAAQRYVRDLKAMELNEMGRAEKQPGFDRGNWSAQWANKIEQVLKDKPLILPSSIDAAKKATGAIPHLLLQRNDPKAIEEFDSIFHAPGLANYFINGGK
jgi:hypothetical protein